LAVKPAFARRLQSGDWTAAARAWPWWPDGYWAAKPRRVSALKLEWNLDGVARADSDTLLNAQYLELVPSARAIWCQTLHFRKADCHRSVQVTASKLVAEFVFPYLNHAQMEPLAVHGRPAAKTCCTLLLRLADAGRGRWCGGAS
jgi:hypothetical protein